MIQVYGTSVPCGFTQRHYRDYGIFALFRVNTFRSKQELIFFGSKLHSFADRKKNGTLRIPGPHAVNHSIRLKGIFLATRFVSFHAIRVALLRAALYRLHLRDGARLISLGRLGDGGYGQKDRRGNGQMMTHKFSDEGVHKSPGSSTS
jgi:hypothetical protein